MDEVCAGIGRNSTAAVDIAVGIVGISIRERCSEFASQVLNDENPATVPPMTAEGKDVDTGDLDASFGFTH